MTEQETNAENRLEALQKSVEGWRKSRTKMEPMPERLWAEVVSLAGEIGVSGVAGRLGINYGAISSRLKPSRKPKPRRNGKVGMNKFIEVREAPTRVPEPTENPSTVIEVTSARGERLTVRVSQSIDIGALVAHFQARK